MLLHPSCFSICLSEVLSVMLWVVVYDMLIAKIARSFLGGGHGLTQLQRMGISYFLIILAMTTAALVEMKRLKGIHNAKPISISWQLPHTMKTMSTAVSLLTISLGNYLSSIVVALVAVVTNTRAHGVAILIISSG